MPVINPLWTAAMRRQWPLVGAAILFLFFTLAHMLAFEPTVARFQRAVARADKLGMPVDPRENPQVVPPRVFALLAENAMPAADAKREGDSGALGAAMLEEMTRLAIALLRQPTITRQLFLAMSPNAQAPQAVLQVEQFVRAEVAALERQTSGPAFRAQGIGDS